MHPGTFEEDLRIAALERRFRGEKRVLLCNAPRDPEGVKKLTDWQIDCLAAALSLTDAVLRVKGTTFDALPRALREKLLVEEINNYHFQHARKDMRLSDPAYWSEFMQRYLKEELTP